jgi:tetratricopeptide (TPR) repeat protein
MKLSAVLLFSAIVLVRTLPAEEDYYTKDNILKFAVYCFQNGEYERAIGEYLRATALSGNGENSDSLFYRIALAYVRLSEPYRARKYGERILRVSGDTSLIGKTSCLISYSYYLEKKYDSAIASSRSAVSRDIGGELKGRFMQIRIASLLKQYRWKEATGTVETAMQTDSATGADTMTRYLYGIGCQGSKARLKKPYVASALSAVVPGSGKLYAHRGWDGIFSFLLIGIMSLQAYAGYEKNGLLSGRCITFGLLGLSFYAGNIYGSYNAALLYNQSFRTALTDRVNLQFDW